MMEDDCANNVIPVPNVMASILSKMIEWCKKHAQMKEDDNNNNEEKEKELRSWDKEFVDLDTDTLYHLLAVANYLDIKGLLDLVWQRVADMIKGKNPEQIPESLFVQCNDTTNYTNTNTFSTNLNLLIPSLSSNSTLNYGFYNTSIGQDPNKAYGLVLCRGDATNNICQNCIEMASDAIQSRCPNRSATIWYDDCLLRYSNTNFFSSLNTSV
ncbi:cysteine-rich receptor-like protein kinase 10 [Cinnamomum micranthum f. kanehirae]|uniref:Cysteine-rich receptor-like protein kinase 10 n=1 Tax=Cinnamomum micranthum f. kanehirae TaxID=337451 RepID=A0A3S3NEV3_9MAGN|nr:cysteine-rich receptor-like protein kinase 10 [Cinnamomum micranthum f. kanehirae]